MGYRELVENKAILAFKLIGNLAREVTFFQSDSQSFDFATQQPITTPVKTTTAKAVFTVKRRQPGESNTIMGELLLLSKDVDDLTIYDKVEIQGQTWRLQPPYANDDYTTTVKVAREQEA